MFDLEAEFVEGLKLMAIWHGCQVADLVARVAAKNPPDLGLAVRAYVFDFFVRRRYRNTTLNPRAAHWRNKRLAMQPPTRHFVRHFK